MRNLIADYPCQFTLRCGVVCVVTHDGFHVEIEFLSLECKD